MFRVSWIHCVCVLLLFSNEVLLSFMSVPIVCFLQVVKHFQPFLHHVSAERNDLQDRAKYFLLSTAAACDSQRFRRLRVLCALFSFNRDSPALGQLPSSLRAHE